MGVFDKMSGAISNVSKDVADKVKTNSDLNKLKQQIAYEEDKLYNDYVELGKYTYANKPPKMSEECEKICEDIKSRLSRIERINVQINDLKGVKVCSECGATIANNFVFCGICGAKLPVATNELEDSNDSGILLNAENLNLAK